MGIDIYFHLISQKSWKAGVISPILKMGKMEASRHSRTRPGVYGSVDAREHPGVRPCDLSSKTSASPFPRGKCPGQGRNEQESRSPDLPLFLKRGRTNWKLLFQKTIQLPFAAKSPRKVSPLPPTLVSVSPRTGQWLSGCAERLPISPTSAPRYSAVGRNWVRWFLSEWAFQNFYDAPKELDAGGNC